MSTPVFGCPTCNTTIGVDGCPRHGKQYWPTGGNAEMYAPGYVGQLKAEIGQTEAEHCYCVCHSPVSSCSYCRHCKGDNEVGEWHRLRCEARQEGHAEAEKWRELAGELAEALGRYRHEPTMSRLRGVGVDVLAKAREAGLLGEQA